MRINLSNSVRQTFKLEKIVDVDDYGVLDQFRLHLHVLFYLHKGLDYIGNMFTTHCAQLACCLTVGGVVFFVVLIHLYIAILTLTGLNRGDVSELLGKFYFLLSYLRARVCVITS